MKKKNPNAKDSETTPQSEPPLNVEISELLDEVLVAEAGQEVWQRFGHVLSKMDEKGLDVFEAYLDGVSLDELSTQNKVSKKEIEDWIKNVKRKLIQGLKEGLSVRQ